MGRQRLRDHRGRVLQEIRRQTRETAAEGRYPLSARAGPGNRALAALGEGGSI